MTDFIYPTIRFAKSFTQHDQLEYTLLLNNIAFAYYQARDPTMFVQEWSVDVDDKGVPNAGEHGAIAQTDADNHFFGYLPTDVDPIILRAYANLEAHEMAHMLLAQKYGLGAESNNLVHYAANLAQQKSDMKYMVKIWRRFVDMPILSLDLLMFDLKKLIQDKDWIMANCRSVQGSNVYL